MNTGKKNGTHRKSRPDSGRDLTRPPEAGNETVPVRSADAHGTRPGPDFERRSEPEEYLRRKIRNRDDAPHFRHGTDGKVHRLAGGGRKSRRNRADRPAGTRAPRSQFPGSSASSGETGTGLWKKPASTVSPEHSAGTGVETEIPLFPASWQMPATPIRAEKRVKIRRICFFINEPPLWVCLLFNIADPAVFFNPENFFCGDPL